MDTVLVNGITYTKASILAKQFRYTADYVGQLCRTKKIDCQLIGRAWYVSESSLLEYKDAVYTDSRAVEKPTVQSPTVHQPLVRVTPRLKANTRKQVLNKTSSKSERPITIRVTSRYLADETELLPRPFKPRIIKPAIPSLPEINRINKDISDKQDGEKVIVNKIKVKEKKDKGQPKLKQKKENLSSRKVTIISNSPRKTDLDFTDLPTVTLHGKLKVESVTDNLQSETVNDFVTPTELAHIPPEVSNRDFNTDRKQHSVKKGMRVYRKDLFTPATVKKPKSTIWLLAVALGGSLVLVLVLFSAARMSLVASADTSTHTVFGLQYLFSTILEFISFKSP